MKFYIPIEVKDRELHGKIFLAAMAANRGFDVIVGPKNELNQLIKFMPAGVYLGLGAFENFKEQFKELKALGFTVVINEEEGLVTYRGSMYIDMRVSAGTLRYVDHMFAWGEGNRHLLCQSFKEQSDKFVVSGNPRFDILRQDRESIFAHEISDIKATYGNYILICTSFSSINHFDKKLDYLSELIRKRTLRTSESIDNFKRYTKVRVRTLEEFLSAIPKLANAFPKTNFVIRPHPSENKDIYVQFEKKFANVKVDHDFLSILGCITLRP